ESDLREWLQRPTDPAARVPYIKSLRPLAERTEELFSRGKPLIRSLNRRLGPAVYLFYHGGHDTLRLIARTGCTTLWQRPSLPKAAKLNLILSALSLRAIGRWRR